MLEISGLTISTINTPRKALCSNVSFHALKNQTLGIVGESGSGKTLTALSLLNLLPPSLNVGGKVVYHDTEKTNILQADQSFLKKYRGGKVAMVFQDPMTSLNPVYKCGGQVYEMIRNHQSLSKKQITERVYELFLEVGLTDARKIYQSYPHQISGGQQQRVMIAMALSNNPDFIIADEPTTALDVTIQKKLIILLKKLQQKYKTGIIFISHDIDLVAEVSEQIIVMKDGLIVEQQNKKDIFASPSSTYTRALMACRPKMGERPEKLLTIEDYHETEHKKEIISSQKPGLKTQRELFHKQLYKGTPLIEIRNANVAYPQKKNLFGKVKQYYDALEGINLSVYPGETLGLVGESGSGKTTLGKAILNLIEDRKGVILYKGENIDNWLDSKRKKFRKSIQFIFQDPYSSLSPKYTVGKALMETVRVHGIKRTHKEIRAYVINLLEKTGLDGSFFNRYPHQLSGGQRQRVVIARALAVEPECIICDESVSALDVSIQAQILNLLNELKRNYNLTYIFISHDLAVVHYMSDRIAVLKDGKLIEVDEANHLYKHPGTEYTRTLISSQPKPF